MVVQIDNSLFQLRLKLRNLLVQNSNIPSDIYLLVNDGLPEILPESVYIVSET